MAEVKSTGRRRARAEAVPEGAAWRTEPSPYGDTELRNHWADLAERLSDLDEAVQVLVKWRADHWNFYDQDALWIESRLEKRVALLKMAALSDEEFRTRTLFGEDAASVCADALKRATAAGSDFREIERVNDEFRKKYKPPIMATNLFMPTERKLAELLQKNRVIGFNVMSEEELRALRGVTVHSG
ncbi:MAG: methane monooxygenase [Mycobacterium sp.]|nr:methane monooxygenase [Mycobacterium sp.]